MARTPYQELKGPCFCPVLLPVCSNYLRQYTLLFKSFIPFLKLYGSSFYLFTVIFAQNILELKTKVEGRGGGDRRNGTRRKRRERKGNHGTRPLVKCPLFLR